MKPKIRVAVGVLAAFLTGAVFEGFVKPQLANAFATAPPVTRPVAERVTTERVVEREVPAPRRHRSWEHEVLIVAGSSGAGAAIGGAGKGARGAAVGAIAGGVAGLIYDLATRNSPSSLRISSFGPRSPVGSKPFSAYLLDAGPLRR